MEANRLWKNLCLLCKSHNFYTAEQAFGAAHIAEKQRQRQKAPPSDVPAKVLLALRQLGFAESEARRTLEKLEPCDAFIDTPALLRSALELLSQSVVKASAKIR